MARSGHRFSLAMAALLVLAACSRDVQPAPGPGKAGVVPGATAGTSIEDLRSYTVKVESKAEIIKPSRKMESWTVVEKKVQNAPSSGYTLMLEDKVNDSPTADLHMIVSGEDGYIFTPEEDKWLRVSMAPGDETTPAAGPVLDPSILMEDAAGLSRSGTAVNSHEAVQRVDTTHYQATGEALQAMLVRQLGEGTQVLSGEANIWIANQGNYLKQYMLQATVQDPEGREVKHDIKLQVTGENQRVVIETPVPEQVMELPILNDTPMAPPEESTIDAGSEAREQAARETLADVPAPPEGQVVAAETLSPSMQELLKSYAMPGVAQVIYVTADSPDRVAGFYHQRLPELGWTEIMTTPGNGRELPALGLYEKDTINLQLVILKDFDSDRHIVLLQVGG